jgi:hypothetical protein
MNINYTWNITAIRRKDVDPLSEVIYQIIWRKIGTDSESGISVEFNGSTQFSPDEISPETFVPYSELTEEVVIGWVENSMSEDHFKQVEEEIARQIEVRKSNDRISYQGDFPWSPVPTAPTEIQGIQGLEGTQGIQGIQGAQQPSSE